MSRRIALPLAVSALILLSGLPPAAHAAAPAFPMATSMAGPVPSTPSISAQGARDAERPDHDGPLNASFLIEWFKGSTKDYSIPLKAFYPAAGASENATPDAAGAPYPAVIMMPYAGSDEGAYDFIAPRIVSWGMVCVVVGVNQSDPDQSGDPTDMEEILDLLETDNSTPSHRLAGMVDREAFGISGHSFGGAKSIIDGCMVPRLRAVQAMAPALGTGDIDTLAGTFMKPYQVQIGRLDTTLYEAAQYSYQRFPAPKALLDIAGVGHGGPFLWDLAIAFFFHHLRGIDGYGTFLYGDSAINDTADLTYYLNYTLANRTFFPPYIVIKASTLQPYEDQTVTLNATFAPSLPVGHPRGTFNWDLNSDGLPERSGPYELSVICWYPQQALVTVRLWFQLGKLVLPAIEPRTLRVTNRPPTAFAGWDITAFMDEPVRFSGEGGDTPSDLASLNFSWSFGDGHSTPYGREPLATHVYVVPGMYPVAFAVRDDDGAVAMATLTATILDVPPTASPVANMTVWKDSEAHFSGRGNDTTSDLPNLTYSWDFGDGSHIERAPSPEADHTYTRSGVYRAAFTVRDGHDAAAASGFTVTVLNAAPFVSVNAPPESEEFQKDDEVSFRGVASDTPTDARFLRFSWDFGDGNRTGWSCSTFASHTYTRGGRYAAVLSAADPEGAVGNATVNLTVRNAPPAVTVASPAAVAAFDEDEAVGFLAVATDTESDQPLLEYVWAIDGIEWPGPEQLLSFWSEGTHHYNLTVRDAEGAATTVRGNFAVRNRPPRLAAEVAPLRLPVNGSILFSANATDTLSDMLVLALNWSFGDGTSCTNASGTHVYPRSGTYAVRVTAEDDEGASASMEFNVTVLPPPVPPGGNGTAPPPAGPPAYAIMAAIAAALTAVLVKAALVPRRRRRPRQ